MQNIKIAFRNLFNSKIVSVINLLGLTLGIVIGILLLSYVRQEKNTDRFIKDYDDIYMFTVNDENVNYIARPMVALLRDRFIGIPITLCSDDGAGQVFLSDSAGNPFKVNRLLNVDSAFFNVFQFATTAGTTQNALDVTSKIVIKESIAKKIFGERNPVGQILYLSTSYFSNEPMEVSAVLNDFPENTAWQFDAAVSDYLNDKKISWFKQNADRWGAQNYTAFCRLPSGAAPDNIRQQLETLSKGPEVTENTEGISLNIQPYSQLYLYSQKSQRSAVTLKKGNTQTLNALELIAALILLMAWINYVSLVSAQRRKRNKSVAVIKMLGGQRREVMQIFMSEAALLLLAVIGLCIYLIPFTLRFFNGLMGTHYTASLFLESENILMAAGIVFTTFLITGLLPGLIFGRYKVLRLMKPMAGQYKEGFFRNALPVLQFSIAISLISCLLVVAKQNGMMLSQDPGFQREQVLYAAANSDILKQSETLVNDLTTVPGISEITFADADLVNVDQHWSIELLYDGEERDMDFDKIGVSVNFFDFFGMKLSEGHGFTRKEANYGETIFNETAVREFGIVDIEKAKVFGTGRIIGVIEDFNLKSAHFPVSPVGFFCNGESGNYIYVKTNVPDYTQLKILVAQVEQKWNQISPSIPFEYRFLDEEWNYLYKKEIQFQQLLSHAGWISIFIACLGLFGLSIFIAEQQTKEIGIRRVNGASTLQILNMLNKGMLLWVGIAFVIATPIAWYAMSRWLENFAYKTTLSWWIFALAGLLSLLVALLTVSWQSWRAATRNPVEALRYE